MLSNNSLNPIRHLLAAFVIITHSYPLLGLPEEDILFQLTNGQLSFSTFAVNAFFAISGYLIFKSLDRSDSIIDYMKKRCLRIFPALWVMLLVTVLITTPFFYESSIEEYYQDKSMWSYFIYNTVLYTHYRIDGVFTHNPMVSLNGSLWTIPYEFLWYILIIPTSIVLKKYLKYILLGVFVLFFLLTNHYQLDNTIVHVSLYQLCRLGTYFCGDMLIYQFGIEKYSIKYRYITFLGMVLLNVFSIYEYCQYIIVPFFILGFGLSKDFSALNFKGDYSYGIYLYGFFVQQMFVALFPSITVFNLALLSIVVSFVFAYFSWHIFEEKVLRLKNKKIQIWNFQL
ncbi:acyltransferase [Flammeovirga pectinis]|uniref:Acyltransferase n=1 Tax=Flammeovirga pectinis TaxID=2494373 RepID=A0A3Q9FMA1_9BACT|nr:acyltransferase [Flammeovirga pectinis]AZQ61914.1 acyltransferase [Flammeovirga pectinis]